MRKFERRAQLVNLWSALAQRGWGVVVLLSLDTKIKAAFFAAALALWGAAMKLLNPPLWAWPPMLMVCATYTVQPVIAVRQAWLLRGIKKIDITQIGADCKKYRDDVLEF